MELRIRLDTWDREFCCRWNFRVCGLLPSNKFDSNVLYHRSPAFRNARSVVCTLAPSSRDAGTDASHTQREFYTPYIIRKALVALDRDYKLFNLTLPGWALAMLQNSSSSA